jgi:hypothetical protein
VSSRENSSGEVPEKSFSHHPQAFCSSSAKDAAEGPSEDDFEPGGLGSLGGSELKIRSYMGDLDLGGLTLVVVVVLPATLHELAGNEDPHPLLEGVRCVLGDRRPCPPAEEATKCYPAPVPIWSNGSHLSEFLSWSFSGLLGGALFLWIGVLVQDERGKPLEPDGFPTTRAIDESQFLAYIPPALQSSCIRVVHLPRLSSKGMRCAFDESTNVYYYSFPQVDKMRAHLRRRTRDVEHLNLFFRKPRSYFSRPTPAVVGIDTYYDANNQRAGRVSAISTQFPIRM